MLNKDDFTAFEEIYSFLYFSIRHSALDVSRGKCVIVCFSYVVYYNYCVCGWYNSYGRIVGEK